MDRCNCLNLDHSRRTIKNMSLFEVWSKKRFWFVLNPPVIVFFKHLNIFTGIIGLRPRINHDPLQIVGTNTVTLSFSSWVMMTMMMMPSDRTLVFSRTERAFVFVFQINLEVFTPPEEQFRRQIPHEYFTASERRALSSEVTDGSKAASWSRSSDPFNDMSLFSETHSTSMLANEDKLVSFFWMV